ncbi:hypothetical protein K0G20_15570 [Bacteroides fragilis]|jgi:hypothetical protein|uniref:hypothetical protein n=1 Tax=Bacteroidaceae TaxID=815 RepID=UPI0023D62EC7|nr:hypothetical protein [Bacteroides acidifaciens]MCE8997911.1 hypothetical protein [Bacteroides fragilis]MCE9005639.1 hypothetical protein [Bacteroides fragilis]MCE9015716.1 hypothetical protein [Bacteroides fragilis]MCE9030272.1 hypothetical protein [Bacteroides fragilis]MDE6821517.1 hypothetical protein [Bacteroides acidifaciens]
MKFFNWIFSSKNKHRIFEKPTSAQAMSPAEKAKQPEDYSSEEMIQNASDWTSYFLQAAPQLDNGTYQKDEIYMFCCWILLDYGVNHGYLDKHSNRDCFYSTIYQAVRNTGKYNQSDSEQFMFRVDQYKWQIKEMLNCDYPRTKMFFPETLYARFVKIDFKHYTPTFGGIDDSLIQFSEFLASFWNKINSELMERYPTKNK